jgi:hypothetical protein
MAVIKGTYYYKGTRAYRYQVTVHDAGDLKTLDYNIHVINPEGKTAIVTWDFRNYGIEKSIRDYIEMMVAKKKSNSHTVTRI